MNREEFEYHRSCQWNELLRFDKYISDVNSKTSFILTIQILLGGSAIANYSSLSSFLVALTNGNAWLAKCLLAYSLLVSLAIAATSILAIMPRLKSTNKPSQFFFKDIAAMEALQRIPIFATPTMELLEDLYVQVKFVSLVLDSKMALLRRLCFAIIILQLLPAAMIILTAVWL